MAGSMRPDVEIIVDGHQVVVPDDALTLLEVLRDRCAISSVKDGCSPQGQCGCCTVLVDGQPRVSCVTPVRRVNGRRITTLDGFAPEVRQRWSAAFGATGASQCGFCTPGIICRFEGLRAKNAAHEDRDAAAKALQAHLCRCTGWQTIVDAWSAYPTAEADASSREAADRRASMEGRSAQVTGPTVAEGRGGFADDSAPAGALVAIRSPTGEYAVAETLLEARISAAKVQGRRTTSTWGPPIALPEGQFDVTLRTSWVEPGYLETDASWCSPGGEPASPLGNGGAFGGKRGASVAAAARRLADAHGRAVRVLGSREDVARLGPKRPPLAGGLNRDGTGVIRVARTSGIADAIASVAPDVVVDEVDVPGPPTSAEIRGAGWVEAEVLLAGACRRPGWITAPDGGSASASVAPDGSIVVRVRAGDVLDEVTLRSYCVGSAHMALSWVTSESLGVDDDGEVHDLTVRSFGILRAVDTPRIEVLIEPDDREPVNGSDAVFAAVAAAVWLDRGLPPSWPTG